MKNRCVFWDEKKNECSILNKDRLDEVLEQEIVCERCSFFKTEQQFAEDEAKVDKWLLDHNMERGQVLGAVCSPTEEQKEKYGKRYNEQMKKYYEIENVHQRIRAKGENKYA